MKGLRRGSVTLHDSHETLGLKCPKKMKGLRLYLRQAQIDEIRTSLKCPKKMKGLRQVNLVLLHFSTLLC